MLSRRTILTILTQLWAALVAVHVHWELTTLVTKVVTTEVVVTTPQKGYNLTRGVVTTLQGGCTSVTLCCVTALKFIHTLTTL